MANLGQMFPDIFGKPKKPFKKYGPKAGEMANTNLNKGHMHLAKTHQEKKNTNAKAEK